MSEQGPHNPSEDISFPNSGELDTIARTHNRGIEDYQRYFGNEVGKAHELILDIGAGDSPFAEQVKNSPDHQATVIRLDPGYGHDSPTNTEHSVAAFGEALPFKNGSFERITSSFMFQHLEPDRAGLVSEEIMRVLAPGGEAMIYASFKPFKEPKTSVVKNERINPKLVSWPTIVIQKPTDFDQWADGRKTEVYKEVAEYATLGKLTYKLMRWGMAKIIEEAGTNRTELGLGGPSAALKSALKKRL